MSITAACIDITGSSRAMDVAYLEGDSLYLRTESNLKSFLDWVTDQSPDLIAVDAPSKENIGLVPQLREEYGIPEDRYENFRVAEVLLKLKGIGLYNTPQEKPPEWMKRGWDLYTLLQDKQYRLLDTPGKVAPAKQLTFEVHPHASFVVGLGWIPQSKQTLAGLLERAAYLRKECSQLGITTTGTLLEFDQLNELKSVTATWDSIVNDGIALPSLSHDQLDAIAGLITAVYVKRGEAHAIGHQDDGVIVIPKPLADTPYQWKHK
tara:strand:+ start:11272 stop:12063 length:792 start_codon:yes stop_codon:yes gene_type:complete